MSVQATMAPFDDFLSFVSSASNPASVLHFLVPVLALFDQALALQIVVAYVAADVSNLAFKWPLQGDRPFWMDPGVRQFGHNTCEVGFGMPSGHVQVTVAVYALLAIAVRKRWFSALVAVLVGLTALSRVHMGAHTILQVSCGALAGSATAFLVHRASPAIRRWSDRDFGAGWRVGVALLAVMGAASFIALECQGLSWLGVDIYASVSKATAACNHGIGTAVSSARGIARDCSSLLGAAVGRSLCLALRPKHTLVSAAAADVASNQRSGWVRAAVGFATAGAMLTTLIQVGQWMRANVAVLVQRPLQEDEEEWVAVTVTSMIYTLLLAFGVGVVPAMLASARSSLLSETDLSRHEREKAGL